MTVRYGTPLYQKRSVAVANQHPENIRNADILAVRSPKEGRCLSFARQCMQRSGSIERKSIATRDNGRDEGCIDDRWQYGNFQALHGDDTEDVSIRLENNSSGEIILG